MHLLFECGNFFEYFFSTFGRPKPLWTVAVDTEEVLGLEVPVGNPFRVEKLQSRGDIRDDRCRLLLREELTVRKKHEL